MSGRPAVPAWSSGALVALGVAASVACYAWTRSDLWLDEALSVEIARLPLADIPAALKLDGAPPLYYFLLHVWISVFGDGDVAVRSMSAVCALGTLPLAWAAGRRLGGDVTARAALLLVASSPFTIRYATEARMYSLVLLLVLGGWLAARRALERPDVGRLAVVAALAGLLVLTHYWALYLLAATAGVLLLAAWSGRRTRAAAGADPLPLGRDPALRTLAAIVVGPAVALVAWSPVFLYQLGHTGTPWGEPASPAHDLVTTLAAIGGGPRDEHIVLGFLLAGLALLALTGRAVDGAHVELDLRTRPLVRTEIVVAVATGALGLAAGLATGGAYQPRYAAVIVPPFLLAAAAGVTVFLSPRVRTGVVATFVVLGIVVGGGYNLVTDRTQGGAVARVITDLGAPGDVVAYCPDQLGPATHRVLGPGFVEVAYPGGPGADPGVERIDWVDYDDRIAAADPAAFAAELLALAGPDHVVWVVWQPTYRLFEGRCETVLSTLAQSRPDELQLVVGSDVYEPMQLSRFGPG
jgi:mannosyltransferase